MLGRDENDIMLRPVEAQIGNPERLRIDSAIDSAGEELTERRRIYSGRCQRIFLAVRAVPGGSLW